MQNINAEPSAATLSVTAQQLSAIATRCSGASTATGIVPIAAQRRQAPVQSQARSRQLPLLQPVAALECHSQGLPAGGLAGLRHPATCSRWRCTQDRRVAAAVVAWLTVLQGGVAASESLRGLLHRLTVAPPRPRMPMDLPAHNAIYGYFDRFDRVQISRPRLHLVLECQRVCLHKMPYMVTPKVLIDTIEPNLVNRGSTSSTNANGSACTQCHTWFEGPDWFDRARSSGPRLHLVHECSWVCLHTCYTWLLPRS